MPETIPDGVLSEEQQKLIATVRAFQESPEDARRAAIERFIDADLTDMKGFFDTIEKNPLTPEQRLAVVTDEDATLVLASAGSGKTSVVVAKAAYLVELGIRQPDEILLLAFGKDAAAEMAERIKERAGVDVDALTFHALGNRIIREVEGKGPALADQASDDPKFRENVATGAIPFRRAYLRSVIDQFEVDDTEIRIHGRREVLERLVMGGGASPAEVSSFVRNCRARKDSNL